MRILGVDPGTRYTGYGVIDAISGRVSHVCHGVISTKAKADLWVRIHEIHQEIVKVVEETQPKASAAALAFPSRALVPIALLATLALGQTTAPTPVAHCPYFNNRAPKPDWGLTNCTWHRPMSCCGVAARHPALDGEVAPRLTPIVDGGHA